MQGIFIKGVVKMAKAKNKMRADGRLQAKVYIGNFDGKAKYKYAYAKTQKELDEKVFEIKLSLRKGIDITSGNDKFGYWAEQWIKLKKIEVSAGRLTSYKTSLKKLNVLYDFKIKKLTAADFQGIIIDNSKLSGNSILQLKNTAKQIMQMAVDNRVIDFNPVMSVKLPKNSHKTTRKALSPEERQWIIDTPDFMQLPAMIMMFAGLRRGELMALLWSDIDMENKTITVNKSAEVIKGKFTVKNMTKTESGMRTVYIPQILADFLAKQERTTNMLVCPSPTGIMMSTKTWNRKWHDYIIKLDHKYGDFSANISKSKFKSEKEQLSINYFTAHCLRHTFITMMYMAGIDVLTAKEQAGHKDIRTTMAIYTHLDSKYKEKSMSKLDEYLQNGCQGGVNISAK